MNILQEDKQKILALVEMRSAVKKIKTISIFIVAFLLMFLFLPWEQTIKAEGELIAYSPTQRNYHVESPIDGYIKRIYVKENQFVKEGELLFEVQDLDKSYQTRLEQTKASTTKQYNNTKAELEILQMQYQNAKASRALELEVYKQKAIQLNESLKASKLQQRALKKSFDVAVRNFDRAFKLLQEGLESQKSCDISEANYMRAKVEYEKIGADIITKEKALSINQKERQSFANKSLNQLRELENKRLSTESTLASLQKSLLSDASNIARYSTTKVLAKKDGHILQIFKNDKNQYIKKGDKVLHFAPNVDKRTVLLKVSSFHMPLVKKGLPVRLQFYGWPTLQVSGWPKIRFGTFAGVVDKVDAISHERGVFYLYITEPKNERWPDNETLRIGTMATGFVRLSVVPIWKEIWRQLNAFPPEMIHPKEKG